MEVVFTGGGTGGHIFPIVAIIREMREIYEREDLRLFYLGPAGPKDDYALTLLSQENVTIKKIWAGKLRRYFSLKNLIDLFKIPFGILPGLCIFEQILRQHQ